MIDPKQLKDTLDAIVSELNGVADYAGIIDPAIQPFILIGKAVDKLIPGLAGTVTNWIEGNPPTDADIAQKAQELAVLGDKGGI